MSKKRLARIRLNKYNNRHDNINKNSKAQKEAEKMGDTDFLFAMPGFTRGMAATLDMGSTLTVYNDSKTPIEADRRALRSDWAVVGKDILLAMKQYEQKK